VKTEEQIRDELELVRAAIKRDREQQGEENLVLFGTQQALGWVLGELMAPSDVDAAVAMALQQEEEESS
jgi:hypothetical protein